jgi:hypothetical protein
MQAAQVLLEGLFDKLSSLVYKLKSIPAICPLE